MFKKPQIIRSFYTLILSMAFAVAIFAQDSERTVIIVGGKTPPKPPVTSIAPASTDAVRGYVTTRVNSILSNPMLKRGRFGVRIDLLDSRTNIYSRDADHYFMPASNMKSYSVAAAMDALSPEYRIKTSVYSTQKPDSNGTVRGSLIIYGRGDPSISTSFYPNDYYRGLDMLVDKIAAAGVKKIEGALIGDETYFNSEPVPMGWEWDDLQWYYGAEVSPLSINDNAVDVNISASTEGTPCNISILPANRLYSIINRCRTTATGTPRKVSINKHLGENVLEVGGVMPQGDAGKTWQVTITRPGNLFVELLKQRLMQRGISVAGPARSYNTYDRNGVRLDPTNLYEVARLESPPLKELAAHTMKPSQNLYAELLLRVVGEEKGDKNDKEKSSLQKGIDVVNALLQKAGATAENTVQYDGSGLSRHNLVTPDSNVLLYEYMDRSPYSVAWRDSLTIAGIDGTLKNRLLGTAAENNARGKTGTIDQVSALTGYVTAKSGERFVFSLLANNLPDGRLRVSIIDQIVQALADYDKNAGVSMPVNPNQR
ncbi:MAG: D-alanyl-D-alanine carboxypeptidase/D-alanyl-D-alanine-endopeptidase [Pyrinomonadaceae bacterium]